MQTLESMTSGCFYMIDYRTCRLIYTSGYIPFMESDFGKSGHTISTEDIERAIDNDERMKLVRAHCAKNQFLASIPVENRMDMVFHTDLRLRSRDRVEQTLHLKCIPQAFTKNGLPWLEIYTVTFSPNRNTGMLMMTDKKLHANYLYDSRTGTWNKLRNHNLSMMEWRILSLSSQGKSELEISTLLFHSVSSIKKTKKSIFGKLGVKNTIEALQMAQNLSII